MMLETAVTYDPFGLLFLILVALGVIGLGVYLFSAIADLRNRNETTDATVNALNVSTNTYANLAQAVINAINQQTINMTNLTQAIVTAINVHTTMYQAQVQADINFKNTLLEYYGMQLTDRDIRHLMLSKNQSQSQESHTTNK